MNNRLAVSVLACLLTSGPVWAQLDLPDGRTTSLNDIFWPAVHLTLAGGGSTEDPADLASGGHDPQRDGLTLQGLELDLSLRYEDLVHGFAAYNFYWGGEDEEWTDELEEAFLKLPTLPGGLEARGGRMLLRYGIRNATHLHSWTTIDQTLVNGRFLGDEGLSQEGGDITWYLPTRFTTALTVSYGEARTHSHSHGHADDHDEHMGEHGEGHDEDAEAIRFNDDLIAGTLRIAANYNDFHQFSGGGSIADGDNGFDDDTQVYGLHVTYTWRENGLEAGGHSLTWNSEIMLREIGMSGHEAHEDEHDEAHDEEHDDAHEEEHEDSHSDLDEWGLYTELIYGFHEQADLGVHFGYVAGIDDIDLEEWFRISPSLTLYLSHQKNLHVRLQYNYDDLEYDGDAHSVWAQLQYSYGGKEVR